MHPILKMSLQRLALGLFTLFVVSVIIAGSVELLPGDLAQEILGQGATPEAVEAFRRDVGLDKPPVERYFSWLGGIAQGDFGTSLANKRPISELLSGRLGNTLFLAGFAAVIAIPLAVTLGILTALYRGSWFDRLANVTTLSSISFPEFFVAYVLTLFLSVGFPFDARWLLLLLGLIFLVEGISAVRKGLQDGRTPFIASVFAIVGLGLVVNGVMSWYSYQIPSAGNTFKSLSTMSDDVSFSERIYRSFLPALTLTLVVTAHMMRMTRASIINLMASPYIEMARLKGMSPARVVIKHALPNALAPIINVIAINLAYLVTGVVVVEVVFTYPGLGKTMVDSVSKRDITVVQGCCLIFAATYILLNLIADILSIATNPRLLHPK